MSDSTNTTANMGAPHDPATAPIIANTGSTGDPAANLQSAKDSVVNSEVSQRSCTPYATDNIANTLLSNNSGLRYAAPLNASTSRLINGELNQQQPDGPRLEEWSGPVAQNVQAEASKTSSEFQDLASSRQSPSTTAANGQTLTNYHSFFYRLLSWQNPRATAITFAISVVLIFAGRYLNILRYFFKFAYFVLGVTASLEVAGKLLFDDGLASKMRPRKYWTVPRDSFERAVDDVEQLVNFFVIESQRILYAENVYATLAVFSAAFLSYWLIKLVPFWGLSLIGTCVLYLAPLIYIKNREAIDNGLNQAGEMINNQTAQFRKITAEKTSSATKSMQDYAGEYSQKAQEYMGSKKTTNGTSSVNSTDFPAAPKQDPINAGSAASPVPGQTEPLISH